MSDEPKALTVQYDEEDAKFLGLPSPGSMNLLKKFCAEIAGTPLCPASLSKGNVAANMLAVVLTGKEMGLSPMQSLRSFWLSPDGRLGMYSDALMAVLRNHGVTFTWHRNDNEGCEVTGRRKDGEEFRASFTVEDAKRAGIYQKERSVWPKYSRAMCRHRCEGEMFRALGSDFGGSNIYEVSEIQDMDSEYATSAPATDYSPEVQSPQAPTPEPAKAGRKPKTQAPIDVKPEVVQPEKPAPEPPQPAPPQPAQEQPQSFVPTYYVISSQIKLPALDKIDRKRVEDLKIAALVTPDLPLAMRNADQTAKGMGVPHIVMTFDQEGRASILHTSKAESAKPAETRMYAVAPEVKLKAAMSEKDVDEAITNPPSDNLSTCELIAQAKANETGEVYVVLVKQGGKYEAVSKCNPPSKQRPVDQPKPGSPEDQAAREDLKEKYQWAKAHLPESIPAKERSIIVNEYIVHYLGISDIKDFNKDLTTAKWALDACLRDIQQNPAEFTNKANAAVWGKAARERADKEVEGIPRHDSSEIAAMQKYYAERKWAGTTTSLAEAYRRATVGDPEKFMKSMKYSGIEALPDREAAAWFAVANVYGTETVAKFTINVDATQYADTVRAIRDASNGQELQAIPEAKFLEELDRIISSAGDAEPSLFQ